MAFGLERFLARTPVRAANDPLTRVATAAALNAALEREATRLARSGGAVGVAIADLESFKAINDEFGHAAGDRVLFEVASRLERVVGENGLVARLGGDEFAVLAPGVGTHEELADLAGDVRAAISREPISLGAQKCTITASVGAALLDRTTTPHLVLRRADEQMYLAKRVSGTDPFDRVSELIVGLLEAGEGGLDGAVTLGVAEVARARAAFVDTADGESWWPARPEPKSARAFRRLAAAASDGDEIVEEVDIGRWLLAAPLRGDGRPIGAFAVERAYPFGKADRIALSRAGLVLGQAMLRLNEGVAARRRIAELERLAFRDENTGLANRRALLAELARLESSGEPLSLLFVDFDGLRAVNNQRSYEHGNALLRAVAAAIEGTLRPGELVARLHGSGGDEFIVVCPGLDTATAQRRAAKLERVLADVDLPADIAPLYGGGSVGYAVREPQEQALELVERAAGLMRARKQARKAIAG